MATYWPRSPDLCAAWRERMSDGLVVLVTGGRKYANAAALAAVLDTMRIAGLVAGGAQGADTLAENYGLARGIPVKVYRAQWTKHGRAAGLIRNQQELDDGRPDICVACPGGRGTADMVRRAKLAGLTVLYVEPELWALAPAHDGRRGARR